VPIVTSTFDNMSSATLGLALRADRLSSEQLRYLSLLPQLLTRVGVIENGKPVSFDEMSERMRNEILNLTAYFSTNPRTERVELVVRGAGLGEVESRRAVEWMNLVLHHPDWRPENLARIRDVVDQTLSALRNTTQGSEESWVNNPATAYRMQSNAAYLAADSFMTRSHNALRLRWLLKEAPAADRETLTRHFNDLAKSGRTREQLKAVLAGTAPHPILAEAYKDLDLTLIEIPDDSLDRDWAYLVGALRDDLFVPPATTLKALDDLRQSLLKRANARMFFVASSANQKVLSANLEKLASSLNGGASAASRPPVTPVVDTRLRERQPEAKNPIHVGLLAPNMKGGVIITSVPSAHYSDAGDRSKQLDYLTSRLYAGYGAHGIFLKTLAAGLAYSNGIRASVGGARSGYYAERTPEIPQTVGFVVNTIKTAQKDPRLGDYAVAQVFGESRAGLPYEARAEGIASDLADDQPPDQVRKFRQSILELRKDSSLSDQLFSRKDAVYARLLPGYTSGAEVPGGIYFAIGADKQLEAWDRYLGGGKLWRLYPRDFWMP
jgi:hypothetical protein